MKGQKPLTPREFLAKYQLPQLVCIHEAHLQQVNEIRAKQINRNRLSKENHQPVNNVNSNKSGVDQLRILEPANRVNQTLKNFPKGIDKLNQLPDKAPNQQVSQQKKTVIDEDCKTEASEEVFLSELIVDDEDYKNRFNLNTLASSSDSGHASGASSNCSENQYHSNSSPDCNKSTSKHLDNLIKPNVNSVKKKINKLNPTPNQVENKKILDLDQPFLLYKSYSSRQVIAHILDVNSTKDSLDHFQRTGPALLIPEGYLGRFFNFILLSYCW